MKNRISPQGYLIGFDPKSDNPFWDSQDGGHNSGLPSPASESSFLTIINPVKEGEEVPKTSLKWTDTTEGQIIRNKGGKLIPSEDLTNLEKEVSTIKRDLGDVGDNVNTNSGVIEKIRGGKSGQLLGKKSDAELDIGWVDDKSGALRIVQMNHTGITLGTPVLDSEHFIVNKVKLKFSDGVNFSTIEVPCYSEVYNNKAVNLKCYTTFNNYKGVLIVDLTVSVDFTINQVKLIDNSFTFMQMSETAYKFTIKQLTCTEAYVSLLVF